MKPLIGIMVHWKSRGEAMATLEEETTLAGKCITDQTSIAADNMFGTYMDAVVACMDEIAENPREDNATSREWITLCELTPAWRAFREATNDGKTDQALYNFRFFERKIDEAESEFPV